MTINQKSFKKYWDGIKQKYPNIIVPEVGMGVTQHVGSDCYPFKITRIVSNTRIEVIEMEHNALDNPNSPDGKWEYGDDIDYEYSSPEIEQPMLLSFRRPKDFRSKGAWGTVGHKCYDFRLGYMRYYQDPSF